MTTRDTIIKLGDDLVRDKGFNAFSFSDISKAMDIKNASIHYHFPSKTDLGVAIVKKHQAAVDNLIVASKDKGPLAKLKLFFGVYNATKAQGSVCIVGSLATDLHSVDIDIQKGLKSLAATILNWVTGILKEGRDQQVFFFEGTPRTRALMVITNMLASVQLSRLTDDKDFITIRETILKELTTA